MAMSGRVNAILTLTFLSFSAFCFSQDYYDYYQKGALAIELGNCNEGDALIREALKLKPKGDMRKDYFPHYYLAICALERNSLEEAQKFAKQAEGSGISFSARARNYATFKKQLQAKLKEPPQPAMELVVLVNSANSIENLSIDELCNIYKGEKRKWNDGADVIPVLLAKGSAENKFFISKVCGITEKDIFEKWENIPGGSNMLVVVNNSESALKYLQDHPGAIAFHSRTQQVEQTRAITVDGKKPDQDGYPLGR